MASLRQKGCKMSKLNTKKTKIKNIDKVLKEKGSEQLKGFLDFIRSQGVVGLAVGLVLGSSASVLVRSLVDNVVMPPLGFLLGSAEGLKGLTINLGKSASGEVATLAYGVFLNDLINFIIIALVIYLTVKVLKLEKLDKKK